jgi:hypothetical protein
MTVLNTVHTRTHAGDALERVLYESLNFPWQQAILANFSRIKVKGKGRVSAPEVLHHKAGVIVEAAI